MRLITTFISILVLSLTTCIANTVNEESLVCARGRQDVLSSSVDKVHKAKKKCPPPNDPIAEAIRYARPLIGGPARGFAIARTKHNNKPVILKTYYKTAGSNIIYEERDKWNEIGGLIAAGPQIANRVGRFHLVLDNPVPRMVPSTFETTIKKAFGGETKYSLVQNLVTYYFNNPQELLWRKSDSDVWTVTPIYFATHSPIDMAISMATQFAGGSGFSISRTTYQDRPVTLKKYFGTTGSDDIDAECNEWRKIELFVAPAVGMVLHDTNKQFYSLILGNFVPEMPQSVMYTAIRNALNARMTGMQADLAQRSLTHAYANPQEFAWISSPRDHWTAIPIRFITRDPIDSAIETAHKTFAGGAGFSIARTRYGNRKVILKTYTTIDLLQIYADCEQWRRRNNGLLDIAVDLEPNDVRKIKRFYMILGNEVPEMSNEQMYAAIEQALHKGIPEEHDYANPQEYIWTEDPSTAEPINFFPSKCHTVTGLGHGC